MTQSPITTKDKSVWSWCRTGSSWPNSRYYRGPTPLPAMRMFFRYARALHTFCVEHLSTLDQLEGPFDAAAILSRSQAPRETPIISFILLGHTYLRLLVETCISITTVNRGLELLKGYMYIHRTCFSRG